MKTDSVKNSCVDSEGRRLSLLLKSQLVADTGNWIFLGSFLLPLDKIPKYATNTADILSSEGLSFGYMPSNLVGNGFYLLIQPGSGTTESGFFRRPRNLAPGHFRNSSHAPFSCANFG